MPKAKKKAVERKAKAAGKPVAKKLVATPALKNAQVALAKLQKEVTSQGSRLAAARKKAAAARGKAAKSRKAVDRNAAKTASVAAIRLSGRLKAMRARVSSATNRLAKLNEAARIKAIADAVKTDIAKRKADMAKKADTDAKNVVKAFEARWRKKRASADAAKLRVAEKKGSAKVKAAVRKAATKARLAERKAAAAKKKAKPVVRMKGQPAAKQKAKKVVVKKKKSARKVVKKAAERKSAKK